MAHLVVCRGLRFEKLLELGRDVVTLGADHEADHRLTDPTLRRRRIAPAARELDVPRSSRYRKLEGWGMAVEAEGED